jgi:hypothetical protein
MRYPNSDRGHRAAQSRRGATVDEVLALTYGYTAKDLAAVRAYVQRVAPTIIARTYYTVTTTVLRPRLRRWSGTFAQCSMV